ncbi:alcohol dehydrogenase catalytic domain-containing protein [Synechocystis sp. PCC 7509]|uniref:alcohol dehydrogenase catalytic domain-containing protein n=1 Tax=Synechocystis sp. PCC 7509 TaxID=927677 RepID=UPI0002ABAFB6|nr:alcohol dehydrogenase catalytic domain-containing protein [Synechocystis sp. PCC 7509]
MKAAIVPALNSPWEIREVPTPEPSANQVLIKIGASGLCYTDVHITKGAIPTQFPRTLGHEPVGEIVEVGVGVTSRKVGDRVGVPWVQSGCRRCEWCLRGKKMFCQQQIGTGVQTQGSHAEYMLAYADSTMLLPDSISYEQAAPVFCAGYTVWSGLRFADPKPHEKVAILGIGGLGHLAVQYSKAAGFETIAITHSKNKEKLVRDLGADEVVADAEALQKMGGADVILVTGNSYKSASAALKGLRSDGRMVLMGISEEPLEVTGDIITNRSRIIGSMQNGDEYLYEALDYVAKGKVKVISETYSLNDISRVYDRVANGEVRFRAVITDM